MRGFCQSVYTAGCEQRLLCTRSLRLTSRVHLVEQLDPEYPLLAACALMTANIYRTRHLLEIRPSCGGEARRLGVFWEKRLPQRGEARGGGLVVGICVGVDGDLDAKVCNNLVGGPAAVARLEGRQRLDLPLLVPGWACSLIVEAAYIWLLLEHGEEDAAMLEVAVASRHAASRAWFILVTSNVCAGYNDFSGAVALEHATASAGSSFRFDA
jgi:hypothetical protein